MLVSAWLNSGKPVYLNSFVWSQARCNPFPNHQSNGSQKACLVWAGLAHDEKQRGMCQGCHGWYFFPFKLSTSICKTFALMPQFNFDFATGFGPPEVNDPTLKSSYLISVEFWVLSTILCVIITSKSLSRIWYRNVAIDNKTNLINNVKKETISQENCLYNLLVESVVIARTLGTWMPFSPHEMLVLYQRFS